MKGFIIFENFNKLIECKEIIDGEYTCAISDCPNGTFSGIINRVSGARCNSDDTYDFETGALIALMKMCGAKKSAEACCEAFPHETSGSIYRENKRYIKRIKELEEKVEGLYTYNKGLIDEIDRKNHEIISLKALKLTNESLKKDNESFRRTCEKLKKENEELFESDKHAKSEVGRLSFEKHRLEEKVEKLKLDCEKLQHGYIDTDMIFCGGRQNGKQYTLLATKREEMWEKILGASKCPPVEIKVAKQDIKTFLRELQDKIPEARWNGSDCPPVELSVPDWFKHDYIYVSLFRHDYKGRLRLCYDEKTHSWINKPVIEYIAPMRWDLFKKGRIVVGVRKEHYEEFKEEITRQFGTINIHEPYDRFNYSFFIYDKNINFIEAIGRSQFRAIKEINNHKVYYWEDVR